jgi:hypothetical protein
LTTNANDTFAYSFGDGCEPKHTFRNAVQVAPKGGVKFVSWQAIALMAFSGLLEMMQFLVPDRHARLIDFVINSLACCAGVLIASLMVRPSLGGAAHKR